MGETAELRTLEILRAKLPPGYTVFHSVHWSKDVLGSIAVGEADFIIVNQSGECVVIEQKSGSLDESSEGLVKRYADGRKNVATQIHRNIKGIRDQFKRQSGRELEVDYIIYCPDHKVRDLNAAGIDASRIVDATTASSLTERVVSFLKPGLSSDNGKRIHRFFENQFHLVPDIHAHVIAGERAMVRLSGGLAEVVSAIEMAPLRLFVRGTAGCGKSLVASSFINSAVSSGERPLLVCFNRPLAERLRSMVSQDAKVDTFYGFLDRFLQSRGHSLKYDEINTPGFWDRVQERVIGEEIEDGWKFDTLVVDEGQDFEASWIDILQLFLKPGANILWLEDPDQAIRMIGANKELSEDPKKKLGVEFVGYRARSNYRSPETIARYIQAVMPFDFIAANPTPGLGVGITTFKQEEDQNKRVATVITELVRKGFKHGDIVILSARGLARASLAQEARVGAFTISRPTGGYDLLGNQVFEKGQIRFDTVYRFKGQQAPAIILTDIEVNADDKRISHLDRLLFSAMTRATVRLEIIIQEGNELAKRLMNA